MLTLLSENPCFGGRQIRFEHDSNTCQCIMKVSVFLPPQALSAPAGTTYPVLYWLSGLTCTDENFIHKAGAQRLAAELGVILVAPDTSPRGEAVPVAPDGAWDVGLGAGFYVNATEEPWNEHYQMYDYIVKELPDVIEENFPASDKRSISGHSMGGHGALTIALKNPDRYESVSAFAPIVSPLNCPWGTKALGLYLGPASQATQAHWKNYDSCALITKIGESGGTQIPLLVDQGSADSFLDEQLQPERLLAACQLHNHPIDYRLRDGYDHSYYFIATFIEEHLHYHAQHLLKA